MCVYKISNIVVYYNHINHNCKTQARLCCSGTNGLLISDFSSSTRGERHNSYYADHTIWPHQRAAHLVIFKISVGRDRKKTQLHLQRPKSNSRPNGRNSTLCHHGPISTLNWLFFKILKFSGPSLPGMTLSTLQPHFLSGDLLRQWWLSYSLRTSVNSTNWLYTWALNRNSSNPNQTEW